MEFPATSGSTANTSNNSTNTTISLTHLISRLDTLLMVLKTCKARECTHPWEVLHPSSDVRDLHDALNARFDEFYEVQQERVHFTKCEKGYIAESEGPMDVKSFMLDEIAL